MLEQVDLPGSDRQAQLNWAWLTAQREGHIKTRAFQLREHKLLLQKHSCLANKPYTQSHLIFQEGKSHGSSALSKYTHLASAI